MTNEIAKTTFLDACNDCICDGYSLDIRYLASVEVQGHQLWDAVIRLRPLPAAQDNSLQIDGGTFVAGQRQSHPETRQALLAVLESAATGIIRLPGMELALPHDDQFLFESEMAQRDRWFSELHLHVVGGRRQVPLPGELAAMESRLRSG